MTKIYQMRIRRLTRKGVPVEWPWYTEGQNRLEAIQSVLSLFPGAMIMDASEIPHSRVPNGAILKIDSIV